MAFTKKHSQIMAAWTRMQKDGCVFAWQNYEAFRDWSELRWAEKAVLVKIFPELPWGPDNAEWMGGKNPDSWTPQWSRAYRSGNPPKSNPCDNCRVANKCTKICPARARWWDVCFGGYRSG